MFDSSGGLVTIWFLLKLALGLGLVLGWWIFVQKKFLPVVQSSQGSKTTAPPAFPKVGLLAMVFVSAAFLWFVSWETPFRTVSTVQSPVPERRDREAAEREVRPVRPANEETLEQKSERLRREADEANKKQKEEFEKLPSGG